MKFNIIDQYDIAHYCDAVGVASLLMITNFNLEAPSSLVNPMETRKCCAKAGGFFQKEQLTIFPNNA